MRITEEGSLSSPICSSSRILPASKTVAEACCIPFGFLYDPAARLHPEPCYVGRQVPRCGQCQAYINMFCRVTFQAWTCIFCNKECVLSLDYQISGTSYDELTYETYECPGASQDIPQGLYRDLTRHVLFIIDDYLNTKHKLIIFNSITKYVEEAPDNTLISLFLMSSVVNVFLVGHKEGAIQTEAFSGNNSMTGDLHKYLSFHSRDMVAHLATSRHVLLDTLRTVCDGLNSKSTLLKGSHNPFIPSKNKRGMRRSNKINPKCLGFAVELVLSLFEQDKTSQVIRHLFVVTGGCPSYGPGAVSNVHGELTNVAQAKQYFSSLGVSLGKARATMHLNCVGHDVFGVETMEGLLENCGGTLLMQKELVGSMYEDIVSCLNNIIGYDSVIRLQTSSNIKIQQIVTNEVVTHAKTLFTKRYPMLVRDKKLSVQFGISPRLNSNPVYVQCTNSYTDVSSGVKTVRVSTVRYDCTVDHEEIVSAICADTAFALCAREYLQLIHAQEDNSDILTRQAHVLITNSQTTVKDKVRVLIEKLLEKMYFMTNGPMVSRMLQHRDDKDYLLHVLLHGDVRTVTHLVKPKVFMIVLPTQSGDGTLQIIEYPPLTLVFRPDRLLVLDTYTDIYIWLGLETQARSDIAQLVEQAEQFVGHTCVDRFPKPRVNIIHDGTSMNRFVECYLMPVHRDSKELQISILPELSSLSPSDYDELMAKYKHVQSKTFHQWLSEMRLVVVSSLPS